MFTDGFEKTAVSAKFVTDLLGSHAGKAVEKSTKLSPRAQAKTSDKVGDWYERFRADSKILKAMDDKPGKVRRKVTKIMVDDYKRAHHDLLPARQQAKSTAKKMLSGKGSFPTKALLGFGGVALGGAIAGLGFGGAFNKVQKKKLEKKVQEAPVGQPPAQIENNHDLPDYLKKDPAAALLG